MRNNRFCVIMKREPSFMRFPFTQLNWDPQQQKRITTFLCLYYKEHSFNIVPDTGKK